MYFLEYYYLRCRSVTYAQRVVRTLDKGGIHGWVAKLPSKGISEGCGYSVKIAGHKLYPALDIVRYNGLELVGIYAVGEDGVPYEVRP